MFIYNNNHILSGYIKQFLSSFNLPTCRIYSDKFYKYYETHGVEHPQVLESLEKFTKNAGYAEEGTEYITKRVNYLRGGTLQKYLYDPNTKKGYWKPCRDGFYYTDKYHRGLTKRLKSEGSIYDAKTHEYLGNYLRYLRDAKGINLMSMYNCFSNVLCQNLQITIPVGTKKIDSTGFNAEGVSVLNDGGVITTETGEFVEGLGAYKINTPHSEKLLATLKTPVDLSHGISTTEESDVLAFSYLNFSINGNFADKTVAEAEVDGEVQEVKVPTSLEINLGSYVRPITFVIKDKVTGVWDATEGDEGAYIIPIACPEIPIETKLPTLLEIPIILDNYDSTATLFCIDHQLYLRLDTINTQLSTNATVLMRIEAGTVIHKYTLAEPVSILVGRDSITKYNEEMAVIINNTIESDLINISFNYPSIARTIKFPAGTQFGTEVLATDFELETFTDGTIELKNTDCTTTHLRKLDFEALGEESHFLNHKNTGDFEIMRLRSANNPIIPVSFGAYYLSIKYHSIANHPTFRINFNELLPKGTIITLNAITSCQYDASFNESPDLELGIYGDESSYVQLQTNQTVQIISYELQKDCAYIDLEIWQKQQINEIQLCQIELMFDSVIFDPPLGILGIATQEFDDDSSNWKATLRANKTLTIENSSNLLVEPKVDPITGCYRPDKSARTLSIKVDGSSLTSGWNTLSINLDESGTDEYVNIINNNFNPASLDWIQINSYGTAGDIIIDDISTKYIGPKDIMATSTMIAGHQLWSCDQLNYIEKILKTTINTLDTDYIVYMLPVKLFESYTVAIDSEEGAELFCALYNNKLIDTLKNKDLIHRTYKKYNRLIFNSPILYDKLSINYWNADVDFGNGDRSLGNVFNENKASRYDLHAREQDLKLFIKLPKTCNSTITVLEGDYCRFNDCLLNNQIDMCITDIGTKIPQKIELDRLDPNRPLRYRHNKAILNFETGSVLDSRITALSSTDSTLPPLNDREFVPISKLQLLALNSGVSHPFADRLIEYLLNWAITPEDEISENISRAQAVMRKNSYRFIADGVWEPKMQMLLYDYIMNDGPVGVKSDGTLNGSRLTNQHIGQHSVQGHSRMDNQYDILGYVDRTAERLYASWHMASTPLLTGKERIEAKIHDTIETVDIYDNRYSNK